MIHPHTEVRFISPEKGYGVVATKFIPKGTITWVLDKLDRFFSLEEVKNMDEFHRNIIETYTFRDKHGNYILCWDNGRFVNHSFNSNCISTAYEFEIAVRDINPGEELTDDYGYLNISESFAALPEKGSKRKMVHPDDLLHYSKDWDNKLLKSFPYLPSVDQPLEHLLSKEVIQKARAIAKGEEKMLSIKNCYYDPQKAS